MRRRARPSKANGKANLPGRRRASKNESAELRDLKKQLAEALERQTATAEILRVISNSPTDAQPVFEMIARSASQLCGSMYAIVTRFDGALIHLVAEHNPRPGASEATAALFPRRLSHDSSVGRAILERAVVHIPDTAADPALALRLVRGVGARSLLSAPMLLDGRAIGSIGVSRAEAGPFPPEQVDLLKTFADQAVIAIENVRLFTELQQKNEALTQANAQVTEALEQQTATSEILRVISRSPTDVRPVFDAIVESA